MSTKRYPGKGANKSAIYAGAYRADSLGEIQDEKRPDEEFFVKRRNCMHSYICPSIKTRVFNEMYLFRCYY